MKSDTKGQNKKIVADDDTATPLLSNNDLNQSDLQSDSQIPFIDQESPYTECSSGKLLCSL